MKKEFADIWDKDHIGVTIVSFLLLGVSIVSFLISLFREDAISIYTLLANFLLVFFTILFVGLAITNKRNNKTLIYIGEGIFLVFYLISSFSSLGILKDKEEEKYIDFSGKRITEVMDWAIAHNVDVDTIYEYSDMIPEYHVIAQDKKVGTTIHNSEKLKISISDGTDPNKEVIIPKMETWDDKKFIDFVEENYLSNVHVEFVSSDILPNTVIEQSKTGTIRRSDELKVTFSYGESRNYDEVVLKDLTKKSKFEAEFYCKQYGISCEFQKEFSKEVKQGKVMSQKQKVGEKINIHNGTVTFIISNGPEIVVPNLTNMTTNQITAWIIQNKLKLSFTDQYDDSIAKNKVIKTNYGKGEKVAQGTIIEVTLSKGALKMKSFKSLDDFTTWAEKYHINYRIQHEYNDKVDVGKVISYSYKKGETLKNDDVIIVKVSDGKKKGVPDVVGMTKAKATTAMKDAGLNVNYVYSYDDGETGLVLSQSISAGSDVTEGTTVTLNISTDNLEDKD